MAIIKRVINNYNEAEAPERVVQYIANPNKCIATGSLNIINSPKLTEDMAELRTFYSNEQKKRCHHIVVSSPRFNYMSIDELYFTAKAIGMFYGFSYQVFFGIHRGNETNCNHIHILVNSVSFLNGKKLHYEKGEAEAFRAYVTSLLGEIVEEEEEWA